MDRYWLAFDRHCSTIREKAIKEGRGVIIGGDLNIAYQDGLDKHIPKIVGSWRDKQPGFTQSERIAFRKFLDQGWKDTFRCFYPNTTQYTWWKLGRNDRINNVGMRLDYFLVNK